MSNKRESVRVIIRCRPFSETEVQANRQSIVQLDESKGEVIVKNPKNNDDHKTFTFDQVFNSNSKQENVYKNTAFPIVESVLEGYNGTVFAYGQTGTGKTFTMEGKNDRDELKGIMPRSFEHIFKSINSNSSEKEFLVRASYLELYNEEIRDLFQKNSKKLEIRERSDTGIYIKDLSTFMVHDAQELNQKLSQGRENRHVGETKMNRDSSRSHSLFIIMIEMSEKVGGDLRYKAGKLNLVDLAGSEKQSKTGAQGDRLKEAININQSLSMLGNVISALVDPKATHIPYRDSKLTRLLQDSLGGNTKTVMVANIGPVDYNFDETISTLRYANRAKSIQNKPKINEDPKDAMLRQFQEEIQKLKDQLNQGGEGGEGSLNKKIIEVQKIVTIPNKDKMEQIEKQIEQQKQEMRVKMEQERKKVEQQKNMAEDQKIKLIRKLEDQEEKEKQVMEKQKKLFVKLQKMEEKLIKGNEIEEQALQQERELMRAKDQIEQKQQLEKQMEEELLQKEIFTSELEKKYNSQKEEVDDKTKKIKLLWQKLKQTENENKELDEFYCQEIDELQDRRRELLNEYKLKNLIVQYFIPQKELQRLEYLAVCNEADSEWILPNLELSGNIIKEKGFQEQYQQHLQNNDLLDMNINVQQDFQEEEDLQELNEHPNVYFVYSEEGLIREEEVAPKKTKKQKEEMSKKEQRKSARKESSRKQSARKEKEKKAEEVIPKAKGLVNRR